MARCTAQPSEAANENPAEVSRDGIPDKTSIIDLGQAQKDRLATESSDCDVFDSARAH